MKHFTRQQKNCSDLQKFKKTTGQSMQLLLMLTITVGGTL